MTSEDFEHSIVVTKTAKRLAWLAVIVINLYFVYFSVLRGITRSTSWQMDYLLACVFQLFVEVLVYETGECLWIHFTIPKLVSEDVAVTMKTVKHAINLAFEKEKAPTVLNSPKFFFVSRHLAEEFPNLFESSVVLAFQSYFPPSDLDTTTAVKTTEADDNDDDVNSWGLNSHDVRVRRRKKKKKSVLMSFMQRLNVSVLVLSTLQHLGTVPIRFQQVIIHTLQPILFSFIIILYFYFLKYPMMFLIPMAFILYEALMYAHRKSNTDKKLIPAINDAAKSTSLMEALVTGADDRSRPQDHVAEQAMAGQDKKSVGKKGNSVNDDSDADDSESSSDHSDGYYARNVEQRMLQFVSQRYSDSDDDSSDFVDYDDSDIATPKKECANSQQLFALQEDLLQADYAVKNLSVMLGLNTLDEFTVDWDENSDDYRYFYQHPIIPFINSQGEEVSLYQIVSKRNSMMAKDYAHFKHLEGKARRSMQKKKEFKQKWDNFRLHDSDLMLPFLDSAGRLVTTDEILLARDCKDIPDDNEGEKKENFKELIDLKKKKQLAEHKLLLFEGKHQENLMAHSILAKYRAAAAAGEEEEEEETCGDDKQWCQDESDLEGLEQVRPALTVSPRFA